LAFDSITREGIPIQYLTTPQLELSLNFIPPPSGEANIMHDFIYGGEEIFGWYGIGDELGITTSQGNIYYQGQLAREVVFYTHYRGGNWMVLRSSDARSDLVIYIHVNSFEPSGRIISLNVVEKE